MTQRSVATVVILTIITCGIYGYYWVYVTANELQQKAGQSNVPPVLSLLLAIFFPSAGYALFGFDSAKCIDSIHANQGFKTDNQVLYIILGILIPVVLIGIVQNEINNIQ